MVIGLIVFLFCCAGIYGFYNGYIYLTYIGFALSLIEQIYGTIKGEQKGLGLIPFCLLLAIGATIAGNNFFESISIIFCFENIITFIGGIALLAIANKKTLKEANKNISQPKNDSNYFPQIYELLKKNLNVSSLDEMIAKVYEFYTQQGVELPENLSQTNNLLQEEKENNLIKILEIGTDVNGSENILHTLTTFYGENNGID